jgi:hypothetical protein
VAGTTQDQRNPWDDEKVLKEEARTFARYIHKSSKQHSQASKSLACFGSRILNR